MKNLFPYKLFAQKLFCRNCQKVVTHGIFARDEYSTLGGMDSHIPLLCCCSHCKTLFIAFSHEFNFCKCNLANHDYAKIHGYNRIIAGNWVYFKGAPKPALVKSVFQGPEKEIIIASYDGLPEQKFELNTFHIQEEEAPEGYRLLPAQSGVALLGDKVYHAIRDQFGEAVGLVNDGVKDKLAVLLKDNTLVFITRPSLYQNLPNQILKNIVLEKLASVFPEYYKEISIDVGQGVVFLKGFVLNLALKKAMVRCVNGIPKVRGCVDFSKIKAAPYIKDSQIEKAIYDLIEAPNSKVYDYLVNVDKGFVALSANCYSEIFYKELENRIGEIPGVKSLDYKVRLLSSMENEILCKEIETDMSLNSHLQGAKIRVSYSNKKYLMEGFVLSAMQKQFALIVLLKKIKTTSFENRLRWA